jgi:xylulokinase
MLFLGIDIGTGGARVVAVDRVGNLVAQAHEEYPLLMPQPGWTEQNPEDWWQATVKAIQAVTKALGARAKEIKSVGLTGQMHGSVFLDNAYQVIRPAILWNDQRTIEECEEITRRVGASRLLELTGNPAITGFTAPKILWLRKHEPENYARINQVMLPKDYIRFRMTGISATDVSDASGTLLFDVAKRTWSGEVCEALDIPLKWLPPAKESPEVTGHVIPGIWALTQIPAGTPVVAGAGDQAAGAVGVGLVEQGKIAVSVGTSGVVFAVSDGPTGDPQGRLHAFCHAVPGKWHLMGVMLSAGGSLRWVRDALYGSAVSYDEIGAEVESVPPGAEGLIFAPYLTGERTPHNDPDARGAFVGLGLHHRRAHLARAAMEGIAFGLKDALVLMSELGISAPGLRITGGGAKGKTWRRIMAAVFASDLQRMAVDEGPAFGAAILGAVGAGVFPDVASACESMCRLGEVEEPNRELVGRYRELYPAFRAAYPSLKPLYKWLKSFQ